MHDFAELFGRFWWLMFPLWWMVIRAISVSRRSSSQDRAFDVLRIYAAKGEQPPPEVLQALTKMSSQPDDFSSDTYQSRAHHGSVSSAWWTFFVFAALTAGFAVGVNGFGADNGAHTAFTIVTVIMAFLAVGSLILALVASFRGRR